MKLKFLLIDIIIYFLFGGAIGLISWGWENSGLSVISLIIFLLYFYVDNRVKLFCLVLGYYLIAARGILFGAYIYFDGIFLGFIVWFLDAFLVSLVWILFWSKKQKEIRFIITIITLVVPPVGLIAWVNPLFSAGAIFPYTQFFGFILIITLVILLSKLNIKKSIFLIMLLSVFGILHTTTIKPKIYTKMAAVDTNFGQLYKDENNALESFNTQELFLKEVIKSDYNKILLSETALGWWRESNMIIWNQLPENKTVYAGASILTDIRKGKSDNAIVKVTRDSNKIIYRQRVPILISMWKPFMDTGANAYLLENKSYTYDENKKIGFFICYEQLLLFLFIQSLHYDIDYMIGVSNLWWNMEKSGENIQRSKMELISRLYNVPFLLAVNRKKL